MRKTPLFAPFVYYCKYDHLTKTGSGQTYRKVEGNGVFRRPLAQLRALRGRVARGRRQRGGGNCREARGGGLRRAAARHAGAVREDCGLREPGRVHLVNEVRTRARAGEELLVGRCMSMMP